MVEFVGRIIVQVHYLELLLLVDIFYLLELLFELGEHLLELLELIR